MRKSIILFITIFFTVLSCSKNEEISNSDFDFGQNIATLIQSDTKAAGQYELVVRCGHSGTNCPGCVNIGSTFIHVPCTGPGTDCTATFSVSLSLQQNDMFQAVTLNTYDLTSEDFFLMPDRSLFVELVNGGKEELWLNIPEQLAVRDSVTELFTFYDLFFTSYPVYKNQ